MVSCDFCLFLIARERETKLAKGQQGKLRKEVGQERRVNTLSEADVLEGVLMKWA